MNLIFNLIALLSFALASTHAKACEQSSEIKLDPGTVKIDHNRNDLELEQLWIATYCLSEEGWVDDCPTIKVNGKEHQGVVSVDASSSREFQTPELSFQFPKSEEVTFCIGMKVLFKGISNQDDWGLYSDPNDRYSILAYCVGEIPEQHSTQPRFTHRKVESFQEFINQLFNRPIGLLLNAKGS